MSPQEAALFGGVAASVVVLARVIEHLVVGLARRNGKSGALSSGEHDMLTDLYRVHNRYDEDGVPLCYFPRSWGESQKELATRMGELAAEQRRTAEAVEKLLSFSR